MPSLREADLPVPFTDATKAEGRRLFEAGDLQLLEGSGDTFYEARVKFFRRHHDVWIDRTSGAVDHACTCPHLENTGTGCAHLYALLLAAGAKEEEVERGEQDPDPILPWFVLREAHGAPALSLAWEGLGEDAGPLRPLPADAEHLSRVDDPGSRAVLKQLEACAGGRRSLSEGGGFQNPGGPWALPAVDGWPLLEAAAATGRLTATPDDGASLRPLVLDGGAPYHLVLGFVREHGEQARLVGSLVRDEDRLSLQRARWVAGGPLPLALFDDRVVRVEAFGANSWLKVLAGDKAFTTEVLGIPAFLVRLQGTGPLPRIAPDPDGPPLPLLEAEPQGVLRIQRRGPLLTADLGYAYGDVVVAPESSEVLIPVADPPRQLRRSLEKEAGLLVALHGIPGLSEDEGVVGRWLVEPRSLDAITVALMESGFSVEAEDRPLRRPGTPTLRLEEGTDWFDLRGAIPYENGVLVPLEDAVLAWRAGRRAVSLGDGSEGLLPRAWMEKLERVLALEEAERDALRMSRLHGLLVAEEMGASGGAEGLRDVLDGLVATAEAAEPPGFAGVLRGYQRQGLGWLTALDQAGIGGCLADDMGLGKTAQVLAHVTGLRARGESAPVLVVAPRSLLWNWEEEMGRFAPGLRITIHHGAGREREPHALAAADVILTTYGTLWRDIDVFAAVPLALAVLDEAQAIKNPKARGARAARRLDARRRLVMTGTPVENHPREMWSLMEFLNPGLLGTERRFVALCRTGEGRSALARILRPFVLRRTKGQVAPELPPRIEQTLYVPMGAEQKALYHRLRNEAARSLGQGNTDRPGGRPLQILEALLRLRQVACHPGLVDPSLRDGPSGKLDLLQDELEQVIDSGHKALVFSQFTALLALVRERLDRGGTAYAYLDGQTRDRQAVVTRFQEDPQCPLFLISLRAGGLGLNLTAADYVFILDPWWNPAVEAQAIDRAHRIGRSGRVVAYRLVTRDTVEEKICTLQASKRDLAHALVAGEGGGLSSLTPEDLGLLFGP